MKTKVENLAYKVKDITLADWGRKEIKLAEMPGLMSLRDEFSSSHLKALELQVFTYDYSNCGFNRNIDRIRS